MMPKGIASVRLWICGVLCAAMMLVPACSQEPTQPPQPPAPVTVYDDGVYAVESMECLRNEERKEVVLRLRVTNNSVSDTALSSVLGVEVTSGETPCPLMPAEQPLDGLLPVGQSREGWIRFELPAQAESFTVRIALDYMDDLWASFDVSL